MKVEYEEERTPSVPDDKKKISDDEFFY